MKVHLKTLLAAGTVAAAFAGPAVARTEVSPYLELGQVLVADLKGPDDEVLTYSQVAAGIDAQIAGPRAQLQLNYRYERRIAWDDNVADDDIHTGIARGAYQVVPNLLTVEAGALAQRARTDIRGDAPGILEGNIDNVSQVYSVYAGPTLATQAGPLDIGAAYRVGYTKAEAGNFVAAPGQPRLDKFDDSVTQLATASVGMDASELPVGWTIQGAYERTDAGQLDQRFEQKGVQLSLSAPVSPSVALVGSIGYEDIEISQKAPLIDATGQPVVDGAGRFVEDPASPRLLAYDQDGIYWDAGVLWRPSRRTSIEARVGRRYGSMTYTGAATWQPSENTALQVAAFDEVTTFGAQLNDNLALLPTAFGNPRGPFGGNLGCVAGASGGLGGCFNPALQSINSSAFRARGVTALYSTSYGPWSASAGAGYIRRTYKTPVVLGTFNLNGLADESWFGQGQVGYTIDDRSSVDGAIFANLYDSGIAGAPNVLSTGATAAYQRLFGRRLSATAALGLYSDRVDGFEGDLIGTAYLGMRYQF